MEACLHHNDDGDDDYDDHDHPFDDEDLVCPISHEIMKDPVVLWPSHQTYDREQICRSLLTYPNLDPATGIRYDEPIEYENDLCTRHHLIRCCGCAAYQPYDDSGFAKQYKTKWNEIHGDGGGFGGDSNNDNAWWINYGDLNEQDEDEDEDEEDELMSFATPLAVSLVEQLRAASTRSRAVWALNAILHDILGDGGDEREIQLFVEQAGGIEAIVDTMRRRRFVAESRLQELACRALHNLSYRSERNKIQIALDGGIEAIVEAMNSCRTSTILEQPRRPVLFGVYRRRVEKRVAAVLEHASKALRSLAYNRENQLHIADAGVIEAILLAVKSLDAFPAVQVEAFRVLERLADSERNRIQIAAVGGIETIVFAMKSLRSVAAVQEKACWVLHKLACNYPTRYNIIADAGGIETLVAALKEHTSVPAVQEKACQALRPMAFCNASRFRIVAAGGIDALLAALTNHPAERVVQIQASWALWNLAADYKQCTRIIEAGAIETVRAAMNRHPFVPKVQKASIGILRCLLPYDKLVEL